MTALARLLFPLPALHRSPATLFTWWESRRPTYNLVVGSAGIVTLGALRLFSALPPHIADFRVPLALVVVYALCANLCYTLGFGIEALLARLWGDDVAPVGPTLFRHGLVFSVGLTLLPSAVAGMSWLFTVARYLLG